MKLGVQSSSAFGVTLLMGAIIGVAHADDTVSVGGFTQAQFSAWEGHVFEGHTRYAISGHEPQMMLTARCDDTASALYRKITIDLEKTPILHWSWRVDSVHPELKDVTKAGDDYAARLYVVYAPSSVMPWRTKAINYVWSNSQPKGSVWPNAFTDQAMMVSLQSGQPLPGAVWLTESRDVRADFKRFFNQDIEQIDGVAVMTDCDNAKQSMTGYYRDIYFSAK